MADKTNGLEAWLNDTFVKSTPRLSNRTKKALTEWAPIVSFAVGILTLLEAWSLWRWAEMAENTGSFYSGTMCAAYSGYACPMIPAPESHFSAWLWLSVIFLSIEGLLYVFAYPKLMNRKKEGWDYLYYGMIINTAYAVVSLFASYDSLSHFVGALLGSAVGLYILFQIRESYLGSKRVTPIKTNGKA
jgi:hypothetical protein